MKLTPRAYQLAIYNSVKENGNTLIVLPTGMGKTLIALMLIDEYCKKGKCLFLTPTKPLAKQHHDSILEILALNEKDVALVTGENPPAKRKEMYKKKVVIATPQTINNDLKNQIAERDYELCIIDECHRAVGDYAYVPIAEDLKQALIVGMTASPGGKRERIKEVLENLKMVNIEIRTSEDADVKPYVKKSTIKWIRVQLSPKLRQIKANLDKLTSKYSRQLGAMGFPPPTKHKGMFLKLRERILKARGGYKYQALVKYSALWNVLHMSELLETQGVYPLKNYMQKVDEKDSKSAKMLMKTEEIVEIKKLIYSGDEDHPKLKKLIDIVKSLRDKKMIVFAQYRDQIKKIEEELNGNGLDARQFVGKREGVTRKMQEKTIAEFRNDDFNILVASSIAEEGLDIPKVDAVIFYEPIPSEIRSIQRRGRAARLKEGEVYVLMTSGTRDEYYYWSSQSKEKKMKTILNSMQTTILRERARREGKPLPPKKISGQTRISNFT